MLSLKKAQCLGSYAVWRERREARDKVLWALVISILLHTFLILLVAWLFRKVQGEDELLSKEKEMQQVTMNLVSPPQYLETHSDQATEKAPQKARFESDKNTRAASELPATGKAPLPTLDGKQAEGLQFRDREYSPGKESGGSPPSTAASARPSQTQQEHVSRGGTVVAPPAVPIPILKPKDHSEENPQGSKAQSPSMPSLYRPPSPADQPGYQSETRVVRIDGNISNRGMAATDVIATPLGRYKKLLSNAIGARWYYLVQRDMDMYRIGTVAIRFRVSQRGKVELIKVVSNTSNELLAATSIQSITDAEMPPIPPDVAASLHNGRIEVDYSFSIISN